MIMIMIRCLFILMSKLLDAEFELFRLWERGLQELLVVVILQVHFIAQLEREFLHHLCGHDKPLGVANLDNFGPDCSLHVSFQEVLTNSSSSPTTMMREPDRTL